MSFKPIIHKSKSVYSKSFYKYCAKIAKFCFQNQISKKFYYFLSFFRIVFQKKLYLQLGKCLVLEFLNLKF